MSVHSEIEKPVCNAAAMRDALNKVGNAAAWIAESCNDQQTAKYMNDIIAIVQAALSEPPRNCDVYNTFEKAKTACHADRGYCTSPIEERYSVIRFMLQSASENCSTIRT